MTAIRAAVFRDPTRPVAIESLTLAEPRAGEVLVRMTASGVCHSDLHVRDGDWPRPGPIAMGHEGAGVVEAVGPGVTALRVGQAVALSWLVPCGWCRACARGLPWACSDSPSFRHAMPDGATVLTTTDDAPEAGPVLLRHRDDGRGVRRARHGRDPTPRRRGSRRRGAHRLLRLDRRRGRAQDRGRARRAPAWRSSGSVASGCRASWAPSSRRRGGSSPSIAWPSKLDTARSLGATDGLLAGDDRAATIEALRDLTDGGPDFVFEAIGRVPTVELAIEALPDRRDGRAGRDDPVHLTGVVRASSRSSTAAAGSWAPTTASPTRRSTSRATPSSHLDGRLPVDRLIDRRIALDDLEPAFDRLRAGDGLRQVIVFD